jgi:uncharacterized protein
MQPRITLITLGVSDLNVSLTFYRDGLGLPTEGIVGMEYEDGAVVFFNMNDNLVLALYPRTALVKDASIPLGPPGTARFSLAHNVGTKEEVDEIMQQAEQAGATITDRARERFWGGYSGYFLDPDGHLWEIAWNPDLPLPG